jgi:hypothetical protein
LKRVVLVVLENEAVHVKQVTICSTTVAVIDLSVLLEVVLELCGEAEVVVIVLDIEP